MRNLIATSAFLLGIVAFAISSHDALAQDLPPDLTPAIGLQFLSPLQAISKEEARDKLKALIFERLAELQGWPGDYVALEKNKAIAIEYDAPVPNPFIPKWYRVDYLEPHIGYWGGGWGFDSLEAAKTAAMEQCGRCTWCGRYTCIPFMQNDAVAIPDQVIDEFITAKQNYIADELKKIMNSERVVLLDRATRALSISQPEWANSITVPPSDSLKVGHPDEQQDYSAVCQDRVIYPLVRVPRSTQESALSRLQSVTSVSSYDEYRRTINTKKDYTKPRDSDLWERMARFATRFEINGDTRQLEKLNWPKYLLDALEGKRVQAVWLEGSVRVTRDGLPLEASEYMAPLAVLADDDLYFGVLVRIPDGEGECYVSKPFSNEVLDLSVCMNNILCATNALDTLQRELRAKFSASPFESYPITDENFAPGEFGMKRVREPSKLLGSPAYEISTYTFQAWSAESEDPFYSLYNRQRFAGVDEERVKNPAGLHLFLKVTHVFTASIHRNGTYAEPEPNQISHIERLVSTAVRNAIETTCSAIGGEMQSDICKMRLGGESK